MTKEEVLILIKESGVVPVVRAGTLTKAQNIVESGFLAGYKVFEITLTVPGAAELIETLSQKFGDQILLGAGTILDVESARKCLKSGAKFIVTPCLIESLIKFCNQEKILIFAGALTPTEVFHAWQGGADVVKVFPISAVGGASYIKALKAPFPEIQLMPTGGLESEDLVKFVQAGALAIGVGFKDSE